MIETRWPYNTRRCEIALGIPGDAQESDFMNATLQPTGKGNLEFSVSVLIEVPEEIETEMELAEYLWSLFEPFTRRNRDVSVQIQLGPQGDGEEEDE